MEAHPVDANKDRAFPAQCYNGLPFRIEDPEPAALFWALDLLLAEGFDAMLRPRSVMPQFGVVNGIDAQFIPRLRN